MKSPVQTSRLCNRKIPNSYQRVRHIKSVERLNIPKLPDIGLINKPFSPRGSLNPYTSTSPKSSFARKNSNNSRFTRRFKSLGD